MSLKFRFLFFALFTFVLALPSQARASSDFITDYNVTYSIQETGNTHAVLNISLTNTTSKYYASSYKMQVGFQKLYNLRAFDSSGNLTPSLTKTANGYEIETGFNDRVVGLGRKLNFTITFDTPEIAQKSGRIWEVNIPGISNPEQFASFNVVVNVPSSFGKPTFSKPENKSGKLVFSKETLGKSGISIAFGSYQYYNFNLVYHLQNTNLFPISTQIALPPQTNYQKVFLDTITPKPLNVSLDRDGNWLAEYQLMPSQKLDVTAKGQAEISLTPRKQPETEQKLTDYLQDKPYWQVSDTRIQTIARQLKTPQAIYDYVVKHLTYDFTRVTSSQTRIGAAGVLAAPSSAVCLEFTDLFIALARSAGIPAREVDGFAYTQNSRERPLSLVKDILHAWPEYYDREKQTWVMVDPTWGNTTGGVDYFHVLDFDHFAFVIKGIDSTYPVPAGGYKYQGMENSKDVNVSFADNISYSPEKIKLIPKFAPQYLSGLPINGVIEVYNIGRGEITKDEINLASSLNPAFQILPLESIPPFGHKMLNVSYQKTPFLTNAYYPLTIRLLDQEIKTQIHVVPFTLTPGIVIGGLISVISLFGIFIIAIKSRRIPLS